MDTLHADVDEIMPGLVADRRWLHEHPEVGMQEVETAKFVVERLRALGVDDIRTGISETGVTALVRGTGSGPGAGKVVLLRADMDALPIQEENDVPYRSQTDGAMHACGHDGHTSMLLAVTRLLMARRDQFAGAVKVLFQPCEETGPGGAAWMIEQGVLEDPHVDAVFGLHLAQFLPVGTIGVSAGPVMAAGQFFRVNVQGQGGHGAAPHKTHDPIVAAVEMIGALQTIVSRNVDPMETAVVSVGMIHGGDAANVIPDRVEFAGTLRTFRPEVEELVTSRLGVIVREIAAAHRVTATVESPLGLPAVVNDAAMAELVRRAATAVVGEERVMPGVTWMASEDFAFFLNERPGCFFFVGSSNAERGLVWDHHHPKFDFDEEALGIGVETMTRTVLAYFDEAGDDTSRPG
ncbi:MAG TPA: amidohydrolase [Thermomicrobiales bacterium]|nr:amidohydrolase [Thermomicrobiales bacterium]